MSSPVELDNFWRPIMAASAACDDPRQAARWFHGRGGCYPGFDWCALDVYWPVVVLTVYREPTPALRKSLRENFAARFGEPGFCHLLCQRRDLPGAPLESWMGAVPDAHVARRGDLEFQLRFDQQNMGFFLDMEPGRRWLEGLAAGRQVLNLFAYTCAFSVVAKAAGAAGVVNVDLSRPALARGRENHRQNGSADSTVAFLGLDILKSWGRIRKRGPFDIILLDPPSYQKSSFIARRDYGKCVRRLNQLARPGARVLACLNAPELDGDFLLRTFAEQAPDWRFEQRLPRAQGFCEVQPERHLKLMVFRLGE